MSYPVTAYPFAENIIIRQTLSYIQGRTFVLDWPNINDPLVIMSFSEYQKIVNNNSIELLQARNILMGYLKDRKLMIIDLKNIADVEPSSSFTIDEVSGSVIKVAFRP